MMEMTTAMTTNLLLLSNAALLAAATIALLRFRHQARRFEKFWDSPTGVSLADTQSLHAKSSAEQSPERANPQLEERVAELQTIVRKLASKEQVTHEPVDNSLPIENAVRMAKHGASIDELIRGCGLNIGEAQLMRKLHGKAQVAARG
jgi:hypothetical protein